MRTFVLVSTLLLLVLRRTFIVVTVEGDSMRPTYPPGQRLLVRRCRTVTRGRVAVIAMPDPQVPGDPAWLVKRVAAVSGDPVPPQVYPTTDATVPPRQLLLLGDNTRLSFDSRRIGYFPVTALLGVVVYPLGTVTRYGSGVKQHTHGFDLGRVSMA
ncbi:S26 family signal peptidase [Amycolatopsis sp. QT-25]|uniref:S26 family signal peptidase n=1 Tax=Amycolatopsis sp. QT-25 TaxID=3034022 RepID=UPI0023EB51EF|nr:S26 family signal peptidase [Amycolatopsis sp. QT-25]WET76524.1 S26 family signal peptidase [Amycolatopsis sp. QT-25]